ncbi:MAG: hypothetical protein JSR58_08150 [Verrucomicrobia bacterium]|nr:hypothetical protein [Verrucomicrobiota bacterium]
MEPALHLPPEGLPPGYLRDLCRQIRSRGQLQISLTITPESDLSTIREIDPLVSSYQLWGFDYHRPERNEATCVHTILSDETGPCIERSVTQLKEQGIHPQKIHLVLATYGYIYKHVLPGLEETGLGEVCGTKQLKHPRMSPVQIEHYLLAHPEARLFHTSLDGVLQSFLYNPKTGDWISFDDEATLLGKVEWAEEQGLRGISFV